MCILIGLFYSDSNDVWIVWEPWGLFSQAINSPMLYSTFSSESLTYLLFGPGSAQAGPSQVPRAAGCVYVTCVVCACVCVLFVWCECGCCSYDVCCLLGVCVVWLYVCACPIIKVARNRKKPHPAWLPPSHPSSRALSPPPTWQWAAPVP